MRNYAGYGNRAERVQGGDLPARPETGTAPVYVILIAAVCMLDWLRELIPDLSQSGLIGGFMHHYSFGVAVVSLCLGASGASFMNTRRQLWLCTIGMVFSLRWFVPSILEATVFFHSIVANAHLDAATAAEWHRWYIFFSVETLLMIVAFASLHRRARRSGPDSGYAISFGQRQKPEETW